MILQIVTILILLIYALFPPSLKSGLGTFEFCETLSSESWDSLPYFGLAFLTRLSKGSLQGPNFGDFHKTRQESAMNQINLFHGEHIAPRIRYQNLFEHLPELPCAPKPGRPLTNPNAMLRCLVYRSLRCITTLSDLVYSLRENPALAEAMGMDPWTSPPGIERFSDWLCTYPNQSLQEIRVRLVTQLIHGGVIQGTVISLDGSAVPSPVKENNLKTSVADRFNKNRYPKADPEARLGVYRVYLGSGTKKIRYFWGYRHHVAVDFDTELPLWETTTPANCHESRMAIPLLDACAHTLHLPIHIVCADSIYDTEKILTYVFQNLHARPIIASNSRYQPSPECRVHNKEVICPANLPMVYKGRMTPKKTGITYRQYCCPLHYRNKMRQTYLLCPADHPKFLSQKGCNYLLRETPSYRSQMAYGSSEFKDLYKKRTSVERVFSRLLSMAMQEPSVRGLRSVQNYCTIAHIAVLLVAIVAYKQGHVDKVSFVRSFVPKFMT
jgi:hypothetical protein